LLNLHLDIFWAETMYELLKILQRVLYFRTLICTPLKRANVYTFKLGKLLQMKAEGSKSTWLSSVARLNAEP